MSEEPEQTSEIEEQPEEEVETSIAETTVITSPDTEDQEVSSLKEQLAAANNKISELESTVASKDEQIANLNNEIESVKEEFKQAKGFESENKEAIKDLEHRLSQKELEITRLEGSVEDLSIAKKKIEDLQKEHKKLEEEMRAFEKIAENEPRFIILKDLQEFGEMRLNQISMKAGVSPAQAKKWLEELEHAGLIEIHGEGRDNNPLVSKKK